MTRQSDAERPSGTDRPSGPADRGASDDGNAAERPSATPPETDVPPDETPAVCGYCGRPLQTERLLALHRGLDHYADLGESEREAFSEAYREEEAELRRFRIYALGALVLLYFGFLIIYALETTGP